MKIIKKGRKHLQAHTSNSRREKKKKKKEAKAYVYILLENFHSFSSVLPGVPVYRSGFLPTFLVTGEMQI